MAEASKESIEASGLDRQPEVAKRFFVRAAEVAATGNFDYAIELYCQGLEKDPEAVEEGHVLLREIARKRKAAGGKPAGMFEKMKLGKQKGPKGAMLAAERLLAKDPDNVALMEAFVRAADKLGAARTCHWIAKLFIDALATSPKPAIDRFLLASDIMEKLGDYTQAVRSCQHAQQMRPLDQVLIKRVKDLSAQETINKGKYEVANSFRDSLENADKQDRQIDQSKAVQDVDFLSRQVRDARKSLDENPDEPGKVFALVEALRRTSREEDEDEAVALLNAHYERTRNYRFKQRAGDIRLRQFRRRYDELHAKLLAEPDNAALKKQAAELAREWAAFEEDEYRERVENYPTDMGLRYEFGLRLFKNRKFDEAIPVLQEAERDPKNQKRAISLLGQAFFNLGFFNEAADTFQRGIDSLEMPGMEEMAKELFYFKGRSLEQMQRAGDADAAYSKVMQWDFRYKDVRDRLAKLRDPGRQAGASPA